MATSIIDAILTVFRGDTIRGSGTLRILDPINPTKMSNYVIPAGATLEMFWPGTNGAVTISSADSEITIDDAASGAYSFEMPNDKSPNLKVDVKQSLDMVVTETNGKTTTFEKVKILTVKDRDNI